MQEKVIVLGGTGQLGQCIGKIVGGNNEKYLFLDKEEGDVLNKVLLSELFNRHKPKVVINCSAYTAVDNAETNFDLAEAINATAPAILAELSVKHDFTLIHISTDFVFEGNLARPLTEQDETRPVSVYGVTKLLGEKYIQEAGGKYFILRTSWLYSEFANNFVKTMLRLAGERESLGVIADQVGSPTYAIDLAHTVLHIINSESDKYGIYHYSNEGVTSWYDFAKAIFEISGVDIEVTPLPTQAYPTPAKRPAYSVMDKRKIKENLGIKIPYWRDSLKVGLQALKS